MTQPFQNHKSAKNKQQGQFRKDLKEIRGIVTLAASIGTLVAIPYLILASMIAGDDNILMTVWLATALISLIFPPITIFLFNKPSRRRG